MLRNNAKKKKEKKNIILTWPLYFFQANLSCTITIIGNYRGVRTKRKKEKKNQQMLHHFQVVATTQQ